MDTSEIHYLTYDPEEIYKDLQNTWIESGGDILYPGDEKEMGIRFLQAVLTQAFAGIDNGLRMATLRYAVREHLDVYGEKRFCDRLEAKRAVSTVRIKFKAAGNSGVIAAGTSLTADGTKIYLLDEEVTYAGYQQTVQARITAKDYGSAGNGLLAGTQMQFVSSNEAVESIYCIADASGGQEREEDEVYKERIRTFGTAPITTGTKERYESVAKSVSSEILDAKALEIDACKVGVHLLLKNDAVADPIIENVKIALSMVDKRPMTDHISVLLAERKEYTLNVQYKAEIGSNLPAKLPEIIETYRNWQEIKLGRPFNPDKLVSDLYKAGASRVILGPGSEFAGGAAEYTEIAENEWCCGTVTLEVLP